ncbi:helix-turn-helix domain-containing protein [Streptomyces decoyicus]|uniref:Helix-turn-helix domain-containing protein n=1 Tax=Streptomyces decoyicus TaxID=249567 RepID=A0ABZ1FH81_9ACTN|nr:helix-turn-helix domain-containing protein [Streptomyces decoyicus]WSB69310.1 helix-turn-helix domain-containing protein [Streptomyces decoyicus]
MRDFAQHLRRLQEGLGLTQEDLARELSVSASTLSRYLSGERVPEREILRDIYILCGEPADLKKPSGTFAQALQLLFEAKRHKEPLVHRVWVGELVQQDLRNEIDVSLLKVKEIEAELEEEKVLRVNLENELKDVRAHSEEGASCRVRLEELEEERDSAVKRVAELENALRQHQSALVLLEEDSDRADAALERTCAELAVVHGREVTNSGRPEHKQHAMNLLYEAERQARTIENPGARSRILATIAGELIGDDPIRSAHMFDEAEGIARSIEKLDDKERALADIAPALARASPDRAEFIARTDTRRNSKLLADVAVSLASTEPRRAERIACTIPDERDERVNALARLAKLRVNVDPEDAMRITQALPDGTIKFWALMELAHVDPRGDSAALYQAENIAWSIADESQKAEALARVARQLFATDPTRSTFLFKEAERLSQEIIEGNIFIDVTDVMRDFAALDIVSNLAAIDPEWAERIARSVADEAMKSQALTEVARNLPPSQSPQAMSLFSEAENIARSAADKAMKSQALTEVARNLPPSQSPQAMSLFSEAENIARSIADDNSLAHISEALAVADSDWAKRVTDLIGSEFHRTRALAQVTRKLLTISLDRAENFARQATPASTQAELLVEVSRGWNKLTSY